MDEHQRSRNKQGTIIRTSCAVPAFFLKKKQCVATPSSSLVSVQVSIASRSASVDIRFLSLPTHRASLIPFPGQPCNDPARRIVLVDGVRQLLPQFVDVLPELISLEPWNARRHRLRARQQKQRAAGYRTERPLTGCSLRSEGGGSSSKVSVGRSLLGSH